MKEFMALVVLLLTSGFFSMAETAITAVSNAKIRQMAGMKIRGAKALERLRENPSRFLATIRFADTVVDVAAAALATSMTIRFFASMGHAETGLPIGISTGVMTLLILVFGDITPKTVALRSADRIALAISPAIEFLAIVLNPIIQLLGLVTRPLVQLFGGQIPEKGPFVTLEDLKLMIALSQKEGVIQEEEREMIHSVFEFGDTAVREVMTPRPDMQCLDSKTAARRAIEIISVGGHTKIPVFEDNIDGITGVLYARDLLTVPPDRLQDSISTLLRPALFVPEGKKLDELLHDMQSARTHIAVVVDEYGVTAGLVTLEDLIEEIVGEIYDEFEKVQKSVERVDDGSWLVDARLSIDELNRTLKIHLPTRDYDTLSGFLFGLIGKVPSVGDSMRFGNISFQVERVHRRRITRVRLARVEQKLEGAESVGG